jgi:CHAD domain-containing protein
MKSARELTFFEARTPQDAVAHLLRVRFAECLSLQTSLFKEDDEALHAFRLACKRLRFAIERVDDNSRTLRPVAEFLTQMTDELGCAHDCVVLAQLSLSQGSPLVARRAKRDREWHVARASARWRRAFRRKGVLGLLAAQTGFHWETRA